ncbi:MAG: hypothetical protein AMXMBFR77_27700 [Phycisphaerales bacterium]
MTEDSPSAARASSVFGAPRTHDPVRTALVRLAAIDEWRQERIGRACGVAQQTVSKWLTGACGLPAAQIVAIEMELGTTELTEALCRARGGRFVPLPGTLAQHRGLSEPQLAARTVEASTAVLGRIVDAAADGEFDRREQDQVLRDLAAAERLVVAMRAELLRRWHRDA